MRIDSLGIESIISILGYGHFCNYATPVVIDILGKFSILVMDRPLEYYLLFMMNGLWSLAMSIAELRVYLTLF